MDCNIKKGVGFSSLLQEVIVHLRRLFIPVFITGSSAKSKIQLSINL